MSFPPCGAEDVAPSPWAPPTQVVLGLPGTTQPQVEGPDLPEASDPLTCRLSSRPLAPLKGSWTEPQNVCCMQRSVWHTQTHKHKRSHSFPCW